MVDYKVQAWCNAKKWPALLAATEALQVSCPASGAEGVDLEKKEACMTAFKKLPSMSGTYIPNRLWRSYCIVQGQDLPLRNSWYGMREMSDREGPAFATLGACSETPLALSLALNKHFGVKVRSPFGMLVAVCEMGSLVGKKGYGSVEGALAAVKAIVASGQSAVAWKAADLARFGDKVTSEWTYHR